MKKYFNRKKNILFDDFFLPNQKNVVPLQRKNGGTVAQLVEQRTENPRVTGSIPVGTTTRKPNSCSAFLLYCGTIEAS